MNFNNFNYSTNPADDPAHFGLITNETYDRAKAILSFRFDERNKDGQATGRIFEFQMSILLC